MHSLTCLDLIGMRHNSMHAARIQLTHALTTPTLAAKAAATVAATAAATAVAAATAEATPLAAALAGGLGLVHTDLAALLYECNRMRQQQQLQR